MNAEFLKDAFGWGFLLWLVGYLLGFAFFIFVPAPLIGWIIMPAGVVIKLSPERFGSN